MHRPCLAVARAQKAGSRACKSRAIAVTLLFARYFIDVICRYVNQEYGTTVIEEIFRFRREAAHHGQPARNLIQSRADPRSIFALRC